LDSCLALQHAARSVGDEPLLITQLVRWSGNAITIEAIERTLAQAQVNASEPSLQRMQAALVRELAEPSLLIGLRGERAGAHQCLQAIADGRANVNALFGNQGAVVHFMGFFPGYLAREHAALLRFHTRLVEAAKLPREEQDAQFQVLESGVRKEPMLVSMLVPAILKIKEAERRTQANLSCALAALAAERFRIARNRWPESLDELVKNGFLDAVPVDAYDGKPIRFKHAVDGPVVYSVGHDKIDNDGNVNRERPYELGVDQGFRLWDVSRRRQPPNPLVPEGEP
jgi:competence protein ComGC